MTAACAVALALLVGGSVWSGCERVVGPPMSADPVMRPGGGPGGPAPGGGGIWISRVELARRPSTGPGWSGIQREAQRACGTPNLSNQEDGTGICVLAKALVAARTGSVQERDAVLAAIRSLTRAGRYSGRALALGRGLVTYVIAADLIDLGRTDPGLDGEFREALVRLRTTPTSDGPANLVICHEDRPNNWGTHCGASRAAIAAYLEDDAEMSRVAAVFRGWLGDRSAYAGFRYGDLSWQCDPARPVGINPAGCTRNGHSIDGVLADDQRRGGEFRWPPPKENYVYEALQGAVVQAALLHRAGYDAFAWENRALFRAFTWLHTQARFPAVGDDTWQPHLVNYFYGSGFPAPSPSRPGKNMGWADWTHGR